MQHQFTLPDMSCGHCRAAITAALQALDPQAHIEVDLPAHRITVESGCSRADLSAALVAAGYPPA